MRENIRQCFSMLTMTVGIGGLSAAACESPAEAPDATNREKLIDKSPSEPPKPIPGSLADEDLPPIIDVEAGEKVTPGIIKSRAKAVMLGKALFWDMQTGSDGQACASCHFAGGADNRARNQLSPGLLGGSDEFDPTRSGSGGGPNYMLTAADFPFHVKKNPADRKSKVLFDTDDVASSQGVHLAGFTAAPPGALDDICAVIPDPLFQQGDTNLRRVEPRNTPTVVNAGFNFRNFWDGRANRIFNGVDPFGPRNEDAFVLEVKGEAVVKRTLRLLNSSLASQAVGPLLSAFEMSCEDRAFHDVGHKLVNQPTIPLARQAVDPKDSVLGGLANSDLGVGLNTTYAAMIQEAFADKFWDSDQLFDANKAPISDPDSVPADQKFSLMETNFALFWGLAIQEYERTLVADNSPFDRYRGGEKSALGSKQLAGLDVFMNKGKCVNCHGTAMFTNASTLHLIPEDKEGGLVERMLMSEERFHYAVEVRSSYPLFPGALGLPANPKYEVDLVMNVEGTPELSGGTIVPGEAHGTLVLTIASKQATCKYDPETLTFGVDASNSRDAQITATRKSGADAGCPKHLRVSVKDDVSVGAETWTDFIRIDNGNSGFLHSGFGAATGVVIREPALYDNGFYNIGVRPTEEDIGVGGQDPFGNPLSFTEQYVQMLLGQDVPDSFEIDPCKFRIPWMVGLDSVLFPGGFKDQTKCGGLLKFLTGVPKANAANKRFIANLRTAVKGAFKTPTLRNIELTAPYMHNGGMSTLEQVVEFYNRGGNFPQNPELDPDITPLNLSFEQRKNLVLFLESLTDPDVVFERAPFDHPQLFIPNGVDTVQDVDNDGVADADLFEVGLELPAVGKNGRDPKQPISTFLGLADAGLK